MIRVVLDSNVYISALLFGGNPRSVLELADRGAFEVFASPALVAEVEETLRDKFQWPRKAIDSAARILWSAVQMVEPQFEVVDCSDPDDNRVLECALACRADYILTGDGHLLVLHPFRGISIVRPKPFLDAHSWKL